jgi:hypothetical protein
MTSLVISGRTEKLNLWLGTCDERYIIPEVIKLTVARKTWARLPCDHSGEESPPRTDMSIS